MQILFLMNNALVEFEPSNPQEVEAIILLVDNLGTLFEHINATGMVVFDTNENNEEPDLPIMERYLLIDHLLTQLGEDVREKGQKSRINTARSYALSAYNAFKARVEKRPSED